MVKVLLVGALALAAVLAVGGSMTPAAAGGDITCTTPVCRTITLIKLNPCQWYARATLVRCLVLRGDLVLRPIATPTGPSADCALALPYANVAPTDATSARWAEFATVCLINQERALRQLGALAVSTPLADAARQHSVNMAAADAGLNHNGSSDRIHNAGFSGGGEDVHSVRGYDTKMVYSSDGSVRDCPAPNNAPNGQPNTTPHDIVANWMCSPGHAANILMASATHIGVGVAIGYAHPGSDTQQSGELSPPSTYTADFAY